jgi:hypothetical protein
MADLDLPAEDRQQIEEFIEHKELGATFGWLASLLVEGQAVTVPGEASSELAAAAREMGLQDTLDWQRVLPPASS